MRFENASTYPRTYAVLKDIKNLCLHDSQIFNAFKTNTHYSWSEISNMLSIGTQPTIIPVKNLTDGYGRTTYGVFNASYSVESVRVRQNLMNGLEIAKLESTIYATAFFSAMTILHELVHYSRHHKKLKNDGKEYGWGFERDAIGFIAELDNVGNKYLGYKKYFENLSNEVKKK